MEIAQELLRYNKLIKPEAKKALEGDSSWAGRLIEALDEGADIPMLIDMDSLYQLGFDGMRSGPGVTAGVEPRRAGSPEEDGGRTAHLTLQQGSGPGCGIPAGEEIISLPLKDPKPISPGPEPLKDRGYLMDRLPSVNRKHSFGGRPRPLASEYDGEVRITFDPAAHMGSKGRINDFQRLFQDRYRVLRDILRSQYGDLHPTEDIGSLNLTEGPVRIVGMVIEVRTTKRGHTLMEVEDPTGRVKALISRGKGLNGIRVVEDEVIGVIGKFKPDDRGGTGIVFIDEIVRADVPFDYRRRISHVKGITAAFTSDIHIGSRNFLSREWDRMIKWLNGEGGASTGRDEAGRVKYLVVAGDLVDGIGAYPDQEKDLVCRDIDRQYDMLAEAFSKVPSYVEIILIPGNHDAVRLAEPQPALPAEYRDLFHNDHIHFLTNPSFFSLSGVNVAAYHGKSIDDLVTQYSSVTYENPVKGMVEMVRSRHFSPTYGMRNQLAPEEVDLLVMREVPDILVSGHVHRFGYENYRGIHLIQGSTWQSQTSFQRMMNLKPQPAKMALVGLDSPDDIRTWELN